MTARQLFPHLPPELRNEIYNYASLPDAKTPPTTEGLPLKLKTFTDKHTVIQIVPVHHGNPALLSLQRYNYQEAKEYSSYLLGNAISLFISIHFKGRSNTFIHEHWAKKISAHLNKLAKMYPWLRKVSTYDIRILWNDKDVMLKGRKRTAGKIASDILRTALGLAGRDMLKKKGDVKVTLSVAPWIIKAIQRCKGVFGYREFLSANGFEGVRRVARQIRGAPGQRHSGYYEVENAPGFVVAGGDEEITLLAVEERKVKWNDWTEGWLFASERVEQVVGGGMKVVKERKGNPLADAVILEGDERTW